MSELTTGGGVEPPLKKRQQTKKQKDVNCEKDHLQPGANKG